MKKLMAAFVLGATTLHASADAVDRAIIGVISGVLVYALANKAQTDTQVKHGNYITHQGANYVVKDPFHDNGKRALGPAPVINWEKSQNPHAECKSFTGRDGEFYTDGGCSVWTSSQESPKCSIYTKPVTTNKVLGRLYVACQQGG